MTVAVGVMIDGYCVSACPGNVDAHACHALARRHAADIERAAFGEEALGIIGIEGDRDQTLAGAHALDIDDEPDVARRPGASARGLLRGDPIRAGDGRDEKAEAEQYWSLHPARWHREDEREINRRIEDADLRFVPEAQRGRSVCLAAILVYAQVMALIPPLDRLRLPAIGAPLFIVSSPELVIAQCTSGIVGSFPALNARPQSLLDEWLDRITQALAAWDRSNPEAPSAPFAVNQIVHRSNDRLQQDMATCAKWRVPIVITSLGAIEEVNRAVHDWGGIILHDVINDRFARKAVEKGADGIIAVAAGAGGHAGTLSPFALIEEIRQWFEGPLILSGAIATGRAILAAQAMGADLAYLGSSFIATEEANASADYKRGITDGRAADIVYSSLFTGVHGNYLKASIAACGLDPDNLPEGDLKTMDFGGASAKAWRDIWGSGQGIGAIDRVRPAADYVARLIAEYRAAQADLRARES